MQHLHVPVRRTTPRRHEERGDHLRSVHLQRHGHLQDREFGGGEQQRPTHGGSEHRVAMGRLGRGGGNPR